MDAVVVFCNYLLQNQRPSKAEDAPLDGVRDILVAGQVLREHLPHLRDFQRFRGLQGGKDIGFLVIDSGTLQCYHCNVDLSEVALCLPV